MKLEKVMLLLFCWSLVCVGLGYWWAIIAYGIKIGG